MIGNVDPVIMMVLPHLPRGSSSPCSKSEGHMLEPKALGATLVRMVGDGACRVSFNTFDQIRSAYIERCIGLSWGQIILCRTR